MLHVKKPDRIVAAAAVIVALALTIGLMVNSFRPPRFSEISRIDVVSAFYFDVTSEAQKELHIGEEALKREISTCEFGRIRPPSGPYSLETYPYEINFIYDNRPWHIVLGPDGWVYKSGDQKGWYIKNPEALLNLLANAR
ncbi:MAG: hypothetical protein LBC26_07370 [Oscillospiraceae bacterium]|jgi:hypothetical protein|nr:hypothetical protein [Oscillospiraceae bacterium]